LDNAIFNAADQLCNESIRNFIIATNDTDFAYLSYYLRTRECYVMGIGTIIANEILRSSYDKFHYYPACISTKIEHDSVIPPGKPAEVIQNHLVHVYWKATRKKQHWISISKFGSAFMLTFPDFIFPSDHPKRFVNIIKIYHNVFEWKRNGRTINIRIKMNLQP
jgi:hypothetical protein